MTAAVSVVSPPAPPRLARGLVLRGAWEPGYAGVLTPPALALVASLVRAFGTRREALLVRRRQVQATLGRSERVRFPPETRSVRERDWTVAPLPADILERRVALGAPAERRALLQALGSGASVVVADLEAAASAGWEGSVGGQVALRDVVHAAEGKATVRREGPGGARPAVLFVRPRGWEQLERGFEVDGKPVSGALFDFGLFFFHNARALLARGSTPGFYLPRVDGQLEARLWNDVFQLAQGELEVAPGSTKATCLVDSLPAALEMDEMLWELREHSAGLACAREAYALRLVQVCHRRGVHALGALEADLPEEAARESALTQVRGGLDGTCVPQPGLFPVARAVFDAHLKGPNQIHNKRTDARVTEADLCAAHAPELPIHNA